MLRLLTTMAAAVALLGATATPTAQAQQGVVTPAQDGAEVATAAKALENDPVYVDAEAESAISDTEADALRDHIAQRGTPVFVAILPSGAGDPDDVTRRLYDAVRRRGVYAVVTGTSFRAGASAGVGLDPGVAPDLATRALKTEGNGDVAATLNEFVDLVAQARDNAGRLPNSTDETPGEGGSAGALGLLAVLGAGIGFAAWRTRRRRRREQEAQVEELRETAHDDLVALGDDVRALDLDVEMPGADEEAKLHYAQALTRYEEAERQLDRATTPDDFAPIGEALEEGRYEMAAAKARLEDRPVPERRPPCFFDPRHGPSTRDVEWSPDGYEPRPVPVCEADAVRLESGQDPMTREIVAGGRRMPLYDAPGYYSPYAGGYFGGFTGFLPGLLFGSMLGGAAFGAGDAYADGGDFGGGGGGDFGGGGGGDFGGGDFGGGDF